MDLSDLALTFAGADDGDVAGFAVTVGDLDGDGLDDLAVGAPCHAGGAEGGGAVHVVYGPIEGGRSLGSADATLVGGQPGDFVGEALGAADLDGDGDDELLIDAPGPFVGADPVADGCFQSPVQPGVNRPGEVYVVDGGERLAGDLHAREVAMSVVTGLAPADFLGLGVNGAGDLDVDGDDDLVVGAPGPGTLPVGGGAAFVFTDTVEGEVNVTSAASQLFAEAPADLAGITVGGADLDGDGRSDLLVGAPGNALPPARPGRVYLFHEPPTGANSLGAADVILEGQVADDLAGRALATGDLIGDATTDLAVGAPGTDTVFVLSGGERRSGAVALADAPVRIDGPAGGSSGYALAVVDLDGDGTRELAVGRPATGTADEAGTVAVFEAPEGQLGFADADVTYRGTPGDNAGFSVAAGDLNGDGIQDLVIGAASIDGGGPGAAYVVPGRPLPGRSGDAQRPDPSRPPGHAARDARASSTLPVTGGSASLGVLLLLAGAVLAQANSALVRLHEPSRLNGRGTRMRTTFSRGPDGQRSPKIIRVLIGLMIVSLAAVGCASGTGERVVSEAAQEGQAPEPTGGSEGDGDEFVPYITTPEELNTAVGIRLDTVDHGMGTGLAPNDCTALGRVATEETHSWGSPIDGDTFVAVNVARFTDASTSSELLQQIYEDVQDCDRDQHPMFGADFEAITDVDAGDRAFVLSTTNDSIRNCEIWVQHVDRIAHTTLQALDPNLSIDQCADVARATARALTRR